jgi:putative DNA primase/helicase
LAVLLALSVVATCLQKRFEVSPYGDSYREPVNIWTTTALPPASRKTAVVSALTGPLETWEREQAELMAPEIRRVNIKRAASLKRMEKLTKKAADCNEPGEREKILSEIAQTEEETPSEMKPPRLWTGDTTPERLQSLLAEHGERMAVVTDEGGIFEVMAGLYNDGRVNLDVFLQGHAGKSIRVDRQGRTAHLEAPALTFGLAVQPAVIADLAQGSKKKFRGNGALARFLYCLPRNNIGLRDVRRRESIPESVKNKYVAGIMSLLEIPPLADVTGQERPRTLTLSAEALDSWLAFAEFIETRQGPNGEFEPIQDWTGKLPGAALRVAGLFHVVEHGPAAPVINQDTIEKALDLCVLLIPHAQAAFDLMGADPIADDAKAVFRWIVDQGQPVFTRRDCHYALKGRFAKVEKLTRALQELQDRRIISEPAKAATGGRPSIVFKVNPAVLHGGE